ncbi:hypothetical protein SAMN05444411_10261 [Lutibacter oricola]|uniref:SpoIIAA-like n=1 Tax=Lutibacter oricola TaxID=762486 RepID=A0A1H2VXE4_9FLAO|nr:hypothetical protein [Lutibacter oricola]SDW73015.1 hypothetical protein SAMN05444411_10261 [Lutibacter oricola]
MKTDYKTYKILTNQHLIIEVYNGDFYIEDVIALKTKLFQDINYKPDYNIIMDLRNATWNISEEEILEYIQFATKNIKSISNRKIAFLTSKPKEVVIGILFSKLNKKLPVTLDVFSTLGASFSFLNFNDETSRTDIINEIKLLKKSL